MPLKKLTKASIALVAMMAGATSASAAGLSDISIVINQSPWLDGFSKMVDIYQSETGNVVKLDVNPYVGLIDKERNSIRAPEGQFDIIIMNPLFYQEMYAGGFMMPFDKIEPGFTLDEQVIRYGNTIIWDDARKAHDPETGSVVAMPVNGNMNFLLYRKDLYEANNLKVPQTWEELKANAVALHNPPEIYGFVGRGARGAAQISYNFPMYLHSFGGSIFRDEKAGDFTVTINSPEAKAALDYFIDLNKVAGHPNVGSIDQGQLIQQLLVGKAAHVLTVNAFIPQIEDPDKSAVVGKIGWARVPTSANGDPAPAAGHWMAGIPKNVPADRQKAALEFLKWFSTYDNQVRYFENGGVVIRQDVYESDIASKPGNEWFKAYAESTPYVHLAWTVPEGTQIQTVLDLRLNQALIGEMSSTEALNTAAEEISKIMGDAGYKTGKLPNL